MNDIALIGLAVMGQNLVLNMARNGLAVTVYRGPEAGTPKFFSVFFVLFSGPSTSLSFRADSQTVSQGNF